MGSLNGRIDAEEHRNKQDVVVSRITPEGIQPISRPPQWSKRFNGWSEHLRQHLWTAGKIGELLRERQNHEVIGEYPADNPGKNRKSVFSNRLARQSKRD